MLNRLSKIFWGPQVLGKLPGSLANEALDFDTTNEDDGWLFIERSRPYSPPMTMTLSTYEIIDPVVTTTAESAEDQSTSQPVAMAVVARTPKKSKKKKAAQELERSQPSGNRKGDLANKIFPGALANDRYLSAKMTESKAFRCSKKSLDRNNKVMMVASCQRKPHLCNISFRHNSWKARAY